MPLAEHSHPTNLGNTAPAAAAPVAAVGPRPAPPKPPRIYRLEHLDTLVVSRRTLTLYPAPRTMYETLPSPGWMQTTAANEAEDLELDPEKEERLRLKSAGPAVKRVGQALWLRPAGHAPLRLLNNPIEDYDLNIAYEYMATLPAIGQWLLAVHLYEGGYYLLIDQRTGNKTRIWGPPAVSPNGRYFVCGNSDVLARYEPNGLQLWLADGRPQLLWQRETDWGVQEPRWLDNRSILFQQDFFDKDDIDTRVMRLKVLP